MKLLIIYILILAWLFFTHKQFILIVSSHYNEDLAWLEKSRWPSVIYSKNKESKYYKGQPNIGKEATAYLKFILDNYDNLPEYTVFIHGHKDAWHQSKGNVLDLLDKAKFENYKFISLNFHYINRNERENEHGKIHKIKELWEEHFKPYLNIECPDTFSYDCCAQFIVHKSRIVNNKKEAYQHWYDMFERNEITEYIFELLWHIIFGEPSSEDELEQYKKFNL